jgi:hypothetical protein
VFPYKCPLTHQEKEVLTRRVSRGPSTAFRTFPEAVVARRSVIERAQKGCPVSDEATAISARKWMDVSAHAMPWYDRTSPH